ncbi:MAG: AAA family ATPase [Pirellulaceae bacterium]
MDLAELIHALEQPAAYPYDPGTVEVRQTHISVVFLAGEFVYKIKKPVDYGFLDFTSLDKRRHDCEQEVRLNQRLAPHVYMGVVAVGRANGELLFEADGEVVEWAVKMHRLPDEATLEHHLLSQAEIFEPRWIQKLAVRLAEFHANAESSPEISSMASFATVSRNANENFEQSAEQVGTTISRTVFDRLRRLNEQTLAIQQERIQSRANAGVPRNTHGDLRLEHVYLFPDRQPPEDLAIIDCIEFSERFRYADPVADIAFLVMGFHLQGRSDLGDLFLRHYFGTRQDLDGLELLPFYLAYRAAVRGKVEGMQSMRSEIDQHDRAMALQKSRGSWLLALSELETADQKPCLILVAGLPGTGKSTLARHLAERANMQVVRSDVVRKELAQNDDDPSSNNPQTLYSEAWNRKTYDECLRRAEAILFEGGRVLVDANFRCDNDRQRFIKTATDWGVASRIFICHAEPSVIQQRLRQRVGDASDADWSIYLKAAKQWEEPTATVAQKTILLDTDDTIDDVLERACRSLRQNKLLTSSNQTTPIDLENKRQMKRIEVFYSGNVQGVGFRFNACRQAKGLNVTGVVKNLPDGRVQLIAEGIQSELENLIERIDDSMQGMIRERTIDWQSPTHQYSDFTIAY